MRLSYFPFSVLVCRGVAVSLVFFFGNFVFEMRGSDGALKFGFFLCGGRALFRDGWGV